MFWFMIILKFILQLFLDLCMILHITLYTLSLFILVIWLIFLKHLFLIRSYFIIFTKYLIIAKLHFIKWYFLMKLFVIKRLHIFELNFLKLRIYFKIKLTNVSNYIILCFSKLFYLYHKLLYDIITHMFNLYLKYNTIRSYYTIVASMKQTHWLWELIRDEFFQFMFLVKHLFLVWWYSSTWTWLDLINKIIIWFITINIIYFQFWILYNVYGYIYLKSDHIYLNESLVMRLLTLKDLLSWEFFTNDSFIKNNFIEYCYCDFYKFLWLEYLNNVYILNNVDNLNDFIYNDVTNITTKNTINHKTEQ